MAIIKGNPYKNTKEIKERDNNYISPKQFDIDIRAYYEAKQEALKYNKNDDSKEARRARRKEKRALDLCGVSLYKMIKGLSNHGKFCGYTWKDEMISCALCKCNRALVGEKYDPNRGYNPFSYFNMIAYHEFQHVIKSEKKIIDTVNKYKSENYQNYAKDSDTPIYVRALYNDYVSSIDLWNEDDGTDMGMCYSNNETEQE